MDSNLKDRDDTRDRGLARLTVRQLTRLLMTAYRDEIKPLRLRVMGLNLDDVRDELRQRECTTEAVS